MTLENLNAEGERAWRAYLGFLAAVPLGAGGGMLMASVFAYELQKPIEALVGIFLAGGCGGASLVMLFDVMKNDSTIDKIISSVFEQLVKHASTTSKDP